MLYPSIFGENLFDDFFRFPDFGRDVEKKLYGKHAAQVMKTDVHEHDDHYEIVIDLPGFKKDQINLELQNGYLTVSAAKGLDKDEKTEKGKLIRLSSSGEFFYALFSFPLYFFPSTIISTEMPSSETGAGGFVRAFSLPYPFSPLPLIMVGKSL